MLIKLKMETENDKFIIGLLNCLSTYQVDPRTCLPSDIPTQLQLDHYSFKRDSRVATLEIDSDEERHIDCIAKYLIYPNRMMGVIIEYNNKAVRVRCTASAGALLTLITEGALEACCMLAKGAPNTKSEPPVGIVAF